MLVISTSLIPHGIISLKGERSPEMLIANPCIDIQCLTPTPIEAILRLLHQTPVSPFRVVALILNCLHASIREFSNDVFVDITDVADKKLAALDTLVSQGYDGAYARKRIEASDGAFGVAASTAYAEGFISLMSAVHYYLPLSDYALKNAKSSDHEKMAKFSYRLPVD